MIKRLLSSLHSLLSKSKLATLIVVKIKNQCDLVLRKRFAAKDMDPAKNGEYLVLEKLLPYCNIYFDIGANKGEWTTFIIEKKAPGLSSFYLYEPGNIAFSLLGEKFSNNDAVILNNMALSNTPGVMDFYEQDNAGGLSSGIKGWSDNNNLIQIKCTTIDEQTAAKNITHIDFMKIDVEGFDLKVIEGAAKNLKNKTIGFIQFEYNTCWQNAGASLFYAYQILRENGYEIYLIEPDGLIRYDIETYGEFYSLANFLAVSPKNTSLIKDIIC